MLARVRDTVILAWRQGRAATMALLPIVNQTEQTKMTWAKPVKSLSAVPPLYKDFFESLLTGGRTFPYTVLTPAFERLLVKTNEKIVFCIDREVYILEKTGDSYQTVCYPIEQIDYIEMKTVLLDASVTLHGVNKAGLSTSSSFRYNSITDFLFTPIINHIRNGMPEKHASVSIEELDKFSYLTRVNFKFMNYARRSLLAGEKVNQTILQSEIRENIFRVLRKTFTRLVSPTHMLILTDRELIAIQEEEKRLADEKYGGTWSYIPLNKIRGLSLNSKENNLFELSIQLPDNICLQYLYQPSHKNDIELLLQHFAKLSAV